MSIRDGMECELVNLEQEEHREEGGVERARVISVRLSQQAARRTTKKVGLGG